MKGKRPKKKVVLFLVEGKSDREALSAALSALYERIDSNIQVFFPIIRYDDEEKGGDITSASDVSPYNIQKKIYDRFLAQFFDQEKIMPKDVYEVIQIVDMDGVYICDDAIEVNKSEKEIDRYYYGDSSIIVPEAKDVEKAMERNRHKRENLEFLVSLDEIKVKQKTVKYSVYYFSCNLDHFLHQDANMDTFDKCLAAKAFAGNYSNEEDGVDRFVQLICEDERACIGQSYQESWEFIQAEGFRSLQSHTNFNVLLEKLLLQGKKDGADPQEPAAQ